jgi:hypothetical protein
VKHKKTRALARGEKSRKLRKHLGAGHSSSKIVVVSLAGTVAAAKCGGWSFRSELARNPENP